VDFDKILEKIPYDKLYPLPAWQRFAAIFALAGLITGGFYFFAIQGKNGEINTLKNNLTKIKKEVEDNKLHAQKLGKLTEKIALLEVAMKDASKQLPSEKEIPELLEQVSNIGTQVGLEFKVFKPKPEFQREFFSEVPVSIKIEGKFHNMLMFFDEIAHLPRIVTIGNIVMRSRKGGTRLTLDCVATTYRFIEGSEKKAAKNKNKKG